MIWRKYEMFVTILLYDGNMKCLSQYYYVTEMWNICHNIMIGRKYEMFVTILLYNGNRKCLSPLYDGNMKCLSQYYDMTEIWNVCHNIMRYDGNMKCLAHIVPNKSLKSSNTFKGMGSAIRVFFLSRFLHWIATLYIEKMNKGFTTFISLKLCHHH